MKESITRRKSFDLALEIIEISFLLNKKRMYVISNQLLKSGTSIGANIEEANAAQTKREFVTKLSIAAKEARETKYWLNLTQNSKKIEINCEEAIASTDEIIKLLTSSIKTAQRNLSLKK